MAGDLVLGLKSIQIPRALGDRSKKLCLSLCTLN